MSLYSKLPPNKSEKIEKFLSPPGFDPATSSLRTYYSLADIRLIRLSSADRLTAGEILAALLFASSESSKRAASLHRLRYVPSVMFLIRAIEAAIQNTGTMLHDVTMLRCFQSVIRIRPDDCAALLDQRNGENVDVSRKLVDIYKYRSTAAPRLPKWAALPLPVFLEKIASAVPFPFRARAAQAEALRAFGPAGGHSRTAHVRIPRRDSRLPSVDWRGGVQFFANYSSRRVASFIFPNYDHESSAESSCGSTVQQSGGRMTPEKGPSAAQLGAARRRTIICALPRPPPIGSDQVGSDRGR
ncbi:hypothetical protein V9T40_008287 [Parthenolecanium corni]|uniref:Uncharacterized protein n=1 Tax=Parthenolecanium corni TaxID=536013 RepID=A0AAN9Y6F6_9HEMI